VRGEHDQLKHQMTNSLGEVEMLRWRTGPAELLVAGSDYALSTLTSEMETAARKAQRLVDPSMPRAPELADFIAKVRATQADPLSRRRAPNLPEPSRHAQAAE